MTRKDTIVIAVLINMGLLALLMATAIVTENDSEVLPVKEIKKERQIKTAVPVSSYSFSPSVKEEISSENCLTHVYHASNPVETPNLQKKEKTLLLEESVTPEEVFSVQLPKKEEAKKEILNEIKIKEETVSLVVKEGDMLEKIAKAHGTTVSQIKKLNHLQNEKIRVGQKLQVPLKKEKTEEKVVSKKKTEEKSSKEEYYVLKSGDNPWKIAKQFNVRYHDILALNQLDEEKAKNLRPGDKIRVR